MSEMWTNNSTYKLIESILCMGLENMYESEHQPRSLQEHKCPLGLKRLWEWTNARNVNKMMNKFENHVINADKKYLQKGHISVFGIVSILRSKTEFTLSFSKSNRFKVDLVLSLQCTMCTLYSFFLSTECAGTYRPTWRLSYYWTHICPNALGRKEHWEK